MSDFSNEFSLAQNVIRDAGKIALAYFSKGAHIVNRKVDKFNLQSLVTEADIEIESYIQKRLLQEYPEYGFIGEEGKENIQDISWIIDPIDGTTLFSRGISDFGIVIALKKGEQLELSCIFLPVLDKLFVAQRGNGAFEGGKRLSVSSIELGTDSIITIGTKMARLEEYKTTVDKLMDGMRCRIGFASSVESTYLASGNIEVLISVDQPIWDVAAEYLLMEEAGAKITDFEGNPLKLKFDKTSYYSYIATNGLIHNKILDIISKK